VIILPSNFLYSHSLLIPVLGIQEVGEQWVREGKKRTIPGGGSVEEYKRVNSQESIQLADAFLSYPFLDVGNFLL
jgi:hypothetical protein